MFKKTSLRKRFKIKVLGPAETKWNGRGHNQQNFYCGHENLNHSHTQRAALMMASEVTTALLDRGVSPCQISWKRKTYYHSNIMLPQKLQQKKRESHLARLCSPNWHKTKGTENLWGKKE